MRKLFLALGAVWGLCLEADAGDWTQWRGSNRDLIVTGESLLTSWPEAGPQRLWQVDLPGDGYSEPVVVNGKIFITGSTGGKQDRRGFLYALNAKDGSLQWQTEYGPEWGASYECARTSPTVVGGRAYVIGGQGHVVCVDAKSGTVVWTVDTHAVYGGRNITWGIAENALIYDGKVICQPGGPDASVVALDAKSGKRVWQSKGLGERSAYCSPALMTLNGRRQVVTMLEDHVVGVDAETGAPVWKHPHRNKYAVHANTPVLCGKDRIFVSSGYGYGSEMLRISGGEVEVVWSDKGSDNHFQGVAFYEGRIFSSGGGRLSCFDPENGRQVYCVEGAKKTSFCITPVGMITYDENGGKVMLVQVKPDSFNVVSSFKIEYGAGPHWSSPVVANGVLYLRRGKGIAAFAVGVK
jgi:outer membrane protein assembly factor BamB